MRLAGWLLFSIAFIGANPAAAQVRTISGRVRDPQGAPVANAAVNLVREDGKPVQQQTTTADGRFIFTEIAPGKYALKVIVSGFEPVNQPILISNDASPILDLRLKLAAAK